MRFMTFSKYAVLSLLAAGALTFHAFSTRRQFFPAVYYLTTSKFSIAALGNLAFVLAMLMYKLVTKVFLGSLRESEVERINERINHGIMETCLAMTVFRQDFDAAFVASFAALGFIKVFHWVLQDRVNFMQTQPVITWVQHLRIASFITFLAILDAFAMQETLGAALKLEVSYHLLFAFEYVILASMVFSSAVKYAFTIVDLGLGRQWEARGLYTFYLELTMDMLHLVVYVIFFVVVFSKYGLPLHLVRDLYLSFTNLRQRLANFLRYRRVSAHIHLLSDATSEDITRAGGVCIICREDLSPTEPVKKLSCSHCFHLACLRSWLERQQSCPTCRTAVFPRATAAASRARAAPTTPAAEAAARPPRAAGAAPSAAATGAQPSPTLESLQNRAAGTSNAQAGPSASAQAQSTTTQDTSGSASAPTAVPPDPITDQPQQAPVVHASQQVFTSMPYGYPPMSMAAFVPMAPTFQYAGQQRPNDAAPALMPMMPIIFPPPGYPGSYSMMQMPQGSTSEQQAASAAAVAAVSAVSAVLAPPYGTPMMMMMPPAAPPPNGAASSTTARSVAPSPELRSNPDAASAGPSSVPQSDATPAEVRTTAALSVSAGDMKADGASLDGGEEVGTSAGTRDTETQSAQHSARLEALAALLAGPGSAEQQARSAAAASAAVAASVDATKQMLQTQMDLLQVQMDRLQQTMPPCARVDVTGAEQDSAAGPSSAVAGGDGSDIPTKVADT